MNSKLSWFSGGAAAAVQACQASSAVLVVLVEPSPKILGGVARGEIESPPAMYARGATAALYRITLSSSLVEGEVSKARAVCLRLQDGSPEYSDFAAFFPVPTKRPCLFMIAPNGSLLVQKEGFVGVAAFVGSLRYAQSCCKTPEAANAAAALLASAAASATSSAHPSQTNDDNAAASLDDAQRAAPGLRAKPTSPERLDPGRTGESVSAARQTATYSHTVPAVLASTPSSASASASASDSASASAAASDPTSNSASDLASGSVARPVHRPISPERQPSTNSMAQSSLGTGSATKSLKLGNSTPGKGARLSCRLPDGRLIYRTFPGSVRFESVRAWVAEEAELRPGSFLLATAFPRRVYDSAADRQQLIELDVLCPSAALVVTLTGQASSGERSSLGSGSSTVNVAASWLGGAVSTAASFVSGFLPAVGPVRTDGDIRMPDAGASVDTDRIERGGGSRASMAEMRRIEESEGSGGVAYDNGNSTQFGSGDVSPENRSKDEKTG